MCGGGGGSERENGGEKERKTGELSYKHTLYTHVYDDCFYIALFSALKQTHCARIKD